MGRAAMLRGPHFFRRYEQQATPCAPLLPRVHTHAFRRSASCVRMIAATQEKNARTCRFEPLFGLSLAPHNTDF
jgi:hypothetical protein